MSDNSAQNPIKATPGKAAAKPANADYPVEEAERIGQQARLRKAAAAGAHALKSPVPGMISGAVASSSAALQKPVDSAGGVTAAAASSVPVSKLEREPSLETAADAKVDWDPMNNLDPILTELRKISAWADTQRKLTKWSLLFLAVFIPAFIGFALLMERRMQTTTSETPAHDKPDWYEVDRNVRAGDFDKAIAIGEELIVKTPQYPEAHHRLAAAYLAAGKLDQAREHYAEAFRLFPSEENEKLLLAIDKRRNAEKP